MPSFYNDSSFSTNYGTVLLPISGEGVTGSFVAESMTLNNPSTVIDIRNHLNEPLGRIAIPDFINGTADILVSGVFPKRGAQFGFDSATYYLTEVGQRYAQADIYKANISFNRKYN